MQVVREWGLVGCMACFQVISRKDLSKWYSRFLSERFQQEHMPRGRGQCGSRIKNMYLEVIYGW